MFLGDGQVLEATRVVGTVVRLVRLCQVANVTIHCECTASQLMLLSHDTKDPPEGPVDLMSQPGGTIRIIRGNRFSG